MSRFVRPETAILNISDGDTLVVKKRLNAGERRQMFASMAEADGQGDVKLNRFKVGIATILAFLIDWSIRDDDGRPVVIRDKGADEVANILDALNPESFAEILQAIEGHERAMAEEREAEKKGPAGETVSSQTSPSLVG